MGGVGPFTVTWLNGYAGDSLSGLPSGLYIVTVVDTNGSFATDSAYIESLDEDCDGILNQDEGGIPGGGGGMADFDGDGIRISRIQIATATALQMPSSGTPTAMAFHTTTVTATETQIS